MRTMADLWRWAMEPRVPAGQAERNRRCGLLRLAVERTGAVAVGGEHGHTVFLGDGILLSTWRVEPGTPDAADVPIPDGVLTWRDRPPLL